MLISSNAMIELSCLECHMEWYGIKRLFVRNKNNKYLEWEWELELKLE